MLLPFLLASWPRRHLGWNHQAQRFRTNSRTIGNDEIAKPQQGFVFLPHGDVEKRVRSKDEKKPVAVAMVGVAKITHRVHGIMKLRSAEVLARLRQRRHKMRMLRARQRHHGKAMRKRGKVLFELMRRPARRNEVNFVKIEAPVGGARHTEMSAMDGVEGAAKQGDAARMMFRGGAVRLRYRQCASQGISLPDFLMNCGLRQRVAWNGQLRSRRPLPRRLRRHQCSHEESCRARPQWSRPILLRLRRLRRK